MQVRDPQHRSSRSARRRSSPARRGACAAAVVRVDRAQADRGIGRIGGDPCVCRARRHAWDEPTVHGSAGSIPRSLQGLPDRAQRAKPGGPSAGGSRATAPPPIRNADSALFAARPLDDSQVADSPSLPLPEAPHGVACYWLIVSVGTVAICGSRENPSRLRSTIDTGRRLATLDCVSRLPPTPLKPTAEDR